MKRRRSHKRWKHNTKQQDYNHSSQPLSEELASLSGPWIKAFLTKAGEFDPTSPEGERALQASILRLLELQAEAQVRLTDRLQTSHEFEVKEEARTQRLGLTLKFIAPLVLSVTTLVIWHPTIERALFGAVGFLAKIWFET